MKNKTQRKLEQLLKKMQNDTAMKGEFEKDPPLFLEKHGIDTDNLTPEILKNVSAAGFWGDVGNAFKTYHPVGIIGDAIFGGDNGDVTNNYNINQGNNNTIIDDSNVGSSR